MNIYKDLLKILLVDGDEDDYIITRDLQCGLIVPFFFRPLFKFLSSSPINILEVKPHEDIHDEET